jgi:hypothetical protein
MVQDTLDSLPGFKLPSHINMLLHLIREELKSKTFIRCFDQAGMDTSMCSPDLSRMIPAMSGFEERSDELYTWYFKTIDEYAERNKFTDPEGLNELAFEFYTELSLKRRQIST